MGRRRRGGRGGGGRGEGGSEVWGVVGMEAVEGRGLGCMVTLFYTSKLHVALLCS